MRNDLVERWSGDASPKCWQPKCHIVLHATDEGYLKEIGQSGRSTLASSLVERRQGHIALRRIDVRAARPNWQAGVLGHELAHIVLADRFAAQPLPRWADEGIAILADSREKQQRHLRDFDAALSARAEFRLFELVTLADYPTANRWGTFYGQSASLVEFLVDHAGEQQFLEFVDVSLDRGYEDGLRHVYGVGIAELEQRWRAYARNSVAQAARPSHAAGADQIAESSPAIGQ